MTDTAATILILLAALVAAVCCSGVYMARLVVLRLMDQSMKLMDKLIVLQARDGGVARSAVDLSAPAPPQAAEVQSETRFYDSNGRPPRERNEEDERDLFVQLPSQDSLS